MEPELVSSRQGFEARVRNLAVGHADDRPIERADARRAQADVIDGSHDVAHSQEVSDPDGLIEDRRCPRDDVLQRFLRGERDGDASHTESCQRGRWVDSEMPQRGKQRRKDHQRIDHPASQSQK